MKSYKLSANASAMGAYNELYLVDHEDLTETAAATAQTIALRNVKVGDVVSACAMKLITPFKDASDAAFNTCASTVGDDGSAARFLTSTEINVNGSEVLAKATANAADTLPYAYLADNTVDLVVGSMSGKSLVNIDTGVLAIFLRVTSLGDLVNGVTQA